MPETLSHQFIAAMEGSRDRLYARALAAEGTPGKAEVRLHQIARETFTAFSKSPQMDAPAAFDRALGASAAVDAPMPADAWARLSAAVQVEAAKSVESKAINPDSVLLTPDPLLAPKKSASPEAADGFDLPGPSRFLLGSVIVIVIGVLLTIYIVTRPVTLQPTTPTTTATSEPAR